MHVSKQNGSVLYPLCTSRTATYMTTKSAKQWEISLIPKLLKSWKNRASNFVELHSNFIYHLHKESLNRCTFSPQEIFKPSLWFCHWQRMSILSKKKPSLQFWVIMFLYLYVHSIFWMYSILVHLLITTFPCSAKSRLKLLKQWRVCILRSLELLFWFCIIWIERYFLNM